jgi:hypothetical protein
VRSEFARDAALVSTTAVSTWSKALNVIGSLTRTAMFGGRRATVDQGDAHTTYACTSGGVVPLLLVPW